MQQENAFSRQKWQRLILFGLFWMGGLLIFFFGSNTYRLFPTNKNALYEWGLALFLLALVVILLRSERWRKYWKIAFALFVAAFAHALNLFLGNWLANFLPAPGSDMQLLAIDKLSQAIPVVLAIILLTRLVGDDLGSILPEKGNLRQGLVFGLVSFGLFAAIFSVIAILQSRARPARVCWLRGSAWKPLSRLSPGSWFSSSLIPAWRNCGSEGFSSGS